MSNKRCATMLAAALVVAAAGGVSLGAGDANAPKGAWDQMMDTFHNPTPWLQMGADFRFRIEYGQNWQTLNDDAVSPAFGHREVDYWNYERYRTRWWTKSTLSEDVSLNTRLTWETRTWNEPGAKAQRADILPSDPRNASVREWNPDEAIFDWLNVNVRNIGDMPLSATVGRQDLLGFGVGWLIMDGTPLDGSRTLYFDAARVTYGDKTTDNVLDLIYINQSAQSNRWLKAINDQDRAVTIADEQGAVAYLTNKSFKPVQLEGYAIYKNDDPIFDADSGTPKTPVTNIPSSALRPWSRNSEVYTFGGAVTNILGLEDHWKYRAEGAYQTGWRDDATVNHERHGVEAFGALTNLEYLFKDPLDNAVHVGYEFDSGDKPGTGTDEQFDLLWGKWPRWSELLIYTATYETDVADLTNLHRFNVGHRIQLTPKASLSTDYHLLFADQAGTPWKTGATGINTKPGNYYRGSLVTAWLRYTFCKQLTGHLMGEYFWPGHYYTEPSDDNAFFIRLNLEYTF